jgi:hypothetical protein
VNEVEIDKIDASGLTGKAKCVYGKMVDSKGNINWILENFKDGNKPSKFDLKFVMATDLPNSINGQTSNLVNNTITIKINSNMLSGRTNLEVARTILHEGIHARLKEFMYRNGNSTISFPGIYDFYRFEKNWSHQQMASYYRSTIAEGLKQFDNGQHLDSYYNALAWVGLNKNLTDHNNQGATYNTLAWDSLSTSEQKTILNTINDEKNNGSKNCN